MLEEMKDFLDDFEEFVEDKQFLAENDEDPDEYRKGYRAGYLDAVMYVHGWLHEVFDE